MKNNTSEPKIIICNGGYRTGSTATFNISRLILESTGNKFTQTLINDKKMLNLVNIKPNIWHNCKIHFWIPPVVHSHVKIIHSYRNPFDVAASWYSRYKCGEKKISFMTDGKFDIFKIISEMHIQLSHLKKNQDEKESLLLPYEEIIDLPVAIKKIADHLKICISKQQIDSIKSKLNIDRVESFSHSMKKGHDPKTQFRKWHVSKFTHGKPEGYKILPQEMISKLIEEFGEYDSWKV